MWFYKVKSDTRFKEHAWNEHKWTQIPLASTQSIARSVWESPTLPAPLLTWSRPCHYNPLSRKSATPLDTTRYVTYVQLLCHKLPFLLGLLPCRFESWACVFLKLGRWWSREQHAGSKTRFSPRSFVLCFHPSQPKREVGGIGRRRTASGTAVGLPHSALVGIH